jgi:hypothetical protein
MNEGAGFHIEDAPETEKVPQRERIIDAVQTAGAVFWRDPDGIAYATVPNLPEGAVMHLRVRGRKFALVCRLLYGAANKVNGSRGERPGSVSDSAMAEAVNAFEAMSLASANNLIPGVRLVETDGAIWIDLGDNTFKAIRVTFEGWAIETRANAPLVRSDGLRALPLPLKRADALIRLRRRLNLPTDKNGEVNFRLIVAWLVAAIYPRGPYCVLAIDGEPGSGKSTICRVLRRLVDPNAADLRGMPRTEDDLLIAAVNSRVVALDNISYIESDMADALCRLATGAGFGKRTLYSDLGETIVSVCRPVLLNGIPSLLARGDLADRSIAVTLPQIPDDNRLTEEAVWAEFATEAPGILALLLDALVVALRRPPTLCLDRLPRMADFARLACAVAPAFGWSEDDMLEAFDANRAASVETVVEADPIAEATQRICAENKPEWTGTATELLGRLNSVVPPEVKNHRQWPKDGARLSARLRRVAPALRRAGVDVALPTKGGRAGRLITLKPVETPAHRFERSATGQPADGAQVPPGSGNGSERSGNGSSVPERSPNPLNNQGRNGGNGGNDETSFPFGGATPDETDEVVL